MEEKTEKFIVVQKEKQVDDDKKWCVYMHTNLINDKKYIGITSRAPEIRWGKNGNGYNKDMHPAFGRAIEKYGWDNFDHVIVIDNLSKQEACLKEAELIAKYKTNCTKYKNPSYGYNMSDGGESGSAGNVWSDEARKRQSEISTGRVVSQETRQKLRESRIGVPLSESHRRSLSEAHMGNTSPRKGVKLSDDTKSKISTSKLENHNGNPVYCIELSQFFYSANDASRQTNIDASAIIKCCRGKQNYAGKNSLDKKYFHWLYVTDYVASDGTIIEGAITLGCVTQDKFDEYLTQFKTERK